MPFVSGNYSIRILVPEATGYSVQRFLSSMTGYPSAFDPQCKISQEVFPDGGAVIFFRGDTEFSLDWTVFWKGLKRHLPKLAPSWEILVHIAYTEKEP